MSGERGVALVLTLMMLALLTILAISFTMTQMTENKAAVNFAYAAKAEEYARGGLDMAMAILIEDRDDNNPVTNPSFPADTTFDKWGADSGDADGFSIAGATYGSVDMMNFDGDNDPTTNPQARWIYFTDAVGRNIGRFAVYVTDEASKMNINAAGNLYNSNPLNDANPAGEGASTDEISLRSVFRPILALVSGVNEDVVLPLVEYRYGNNDTPDTIPYNPDNPQGDDTPFLTTSEIEMVAGIGPVTHNALSPYITVHSLEDDRDEIRGWRGVINDTLSVDDIRNTIALVGLTADANTRNQIAVNIKDFIDADSDPTGYGGRYGVDMTAYLNEVEAIPPWLDSAGNEIQPRPTAPQAGDKYDYGEFIEIFYPYPIPPGGSVTLSYYRIRVDRIFDVYYVPDMVFTEDDRYYVIGDTSGHEYVVDSQGRGDWVSFYDRSTYPVTSDVGLPLNLPVGLEDLTLEKIDQAGFFVTIEVTNYGSAPLWSR